MNEKFTRKSIYVLFGLILMLQSFGAKCQLNDSKWKFSNPKQFGFTILDVSFNDDNNGIAVGNSGGIAKTSNAGVNWKYAAFTFTDAGNMIQKPTIYGVQYVNPTLAYAVGDYGLLAKSNDGGLNWSVINNPLFANGKIIYGLHFINKDTGYIGGQPNNTPDGMPKLYFTKNGGSTWDSIAAPIGPKTKIGYIANPSLPPLVVNVNAKDKEIHKIVFVNDSIGYVVGSGWSSAPYDDEYGGISDSYAVSACLVWKFKSGVLTDYSISKERTGYEGIAYLPIDPSSTYNPLDPAQQTIKAVQPINDSLILVASFNNAIVVRIHTGVSDSTENIAVPGTYDPGKYEMLNYPYPPQGAPSIPVTQVLLSSNIWNIRKAADQAIIMTSGQGLISVSRDSGATWALQQAIPLGNYHSYNDLFALDITPNGKIFVMGANGVETDSTNGSAWTSTSGYKSVTLNGGYVDIDFLDCNNAVATGGGQITTTIDGGKNWIDKVRQDFVDNYIYINGMSYATATKLVMGTSIGTIYNSADQGTTLDPIFTDPYFDDYSGNGQITGLTTFGADSIWAFGMRGAYTPGVDERTVLFRSFDAGTTWDSVKTFPLGDHAGAITKVKFPSKNIGYSSGDLGRIYKTTDAGATWTDISPFPALNATISYSGLYAVDNNTVFVTGNGYPLQVVYKTTDGGLNWVDITPNITNVFTGYYNGIIMHDANNGYVLVGGSLLITTNGGTSWTVDQAPSGGFYCAAFANRTVPAGTPFENRKLFIGTITFGFGATPGGHIMEYGDPAKIEVSSSDVITNTTCAQANAGAITINPTGGIAPYTYSIDGGTFQSSNNFAGLTQGTHNIDIRDSQCGSVTKTITLGLTNDLMLTTNTNDTSVCSGTPVQLIANSAATAYSWSPATGLSDAAISNPVATTNTEATYIVTGTLGTCIKTASVNIHIYANPFADAGPDQTIVTGGQVALTGSGTNAATISWSPANTLTGASTFSPLANPAFTTTYTLTVTDNNHCISTDETKVIVEGVCTNPMNAFTPNGDGKNDKWFATNGTGCTSQVSVAVFNRYGSPVYKNDDYHNDWDGTYHGKPLPDATYYYVVTYKLINGRTSVKKGDVTILR
ncbi:MAG: gliding motility-associated C-terminal domain-containing protein [Ferruginibacter sp.]